MNSSTHNSPQNVLFLDGDCVFCQRSAIFLHHLDKRGALYFAPLQGTTAEILPELWRTTVDAKQKAAGAAVLTEFIHSAKPIHWRGVDAILRSLYLAGGIGIVFWPLHWLPKWIKWPCYNFIARHRHCLTSSNAKCSLPTDSFRKHMLP